MRHSDLTDAEFTVFKETYSLHYAAVYRHICRKTLDDVKADDYTSETFQRMLDHISEFNDLSSDDSLKLLYSYANSIIIENERKEARHNTFNFSDMESEDDEGMVISFEETIESDIDVQNIVVNNELKAALVREISSLESKKRKAFILKYAECRKTDDVAKILGMNPSTLRTMLRKTAEELKVKLEAYLDR